MGQLERRIEKSLCRPINPYSTIFFAFFSITWGVWILLPFWSAFDSATIFDKMDAAFPIYSEECWGALAILSGLFTIYAIHKDSIKELIVSQYVGAWYWGIVSVMMWWADWHNTGGVVYGTVSLILVYFYANLRGNKKRWE